MTVAACYLTQEAVVLGADSTTTYTTPDGSQHYLDYAQKIFEIGESGTMSIAHWGVGMMQYRTMVAETDDDLRATPPSSIEQVVERWRDKFWAEYEKVLAPELAAARALSTIPARSPDQQKVLDQILSTRAGGFCVVGRWPPNRTPRAFEIIYDPLRDKGNSITEMNVGWKFWGCPNVVERLAFGMDRGIADAMMASGKWTGTRAELDALKLPFNLEPPFVLPLREAVDWVHSMIYSTVKIFKFSALKPVCGGPIEIAAITSDRPFRWVRHKTLGEALGRHHQ